MSSDYGREETLKLLLGGRNQTGRGQSFLSRALASAEDLTPEEKSLMLMGSMADDMHALRTWFFGRYTLESQIDRTVRTLTPGQSAKIGEVTNLLFGGSLMFVSVGLTSKNVDVSMIIDAQSHDFPAASLVDGSFTAAIAPSVVVVRDMPTEAPQVVLATNFGSPEGFPVFDSLVITVTSREETDAVSIVESFVRVKRFWE